MTTERPRDPWRLAMARFRRNRAAVAGLWVLVLVTLAAIGIEWVSPHGVAEQDLALARLAPSWDHPFGTDAVGRDLLTRTFHGGRISLAVGVVATLVSMVIGVSWGLVAGWRGGRTDELMMRVVDLLYGLPFLFFVVLLVAWFGQSLVLLFVALGAVQWLTTSRIVRAETRRLRSAEFVIAARALGVPTVAILLRHVLPNLIGPVLVIATLTVPTVMLEEAFLSFLGLGVQPPLASWGSLASEGAAAINPVDSMWWLIVFPGALFSITLLALNFVGDGLRDAFDVRGGR
jgi:oligopeptide transport system permease protein